MKKATQGKPDRFGRKYDTAVEACQKYGLDTAEAGAVLLYTQLANAGLRVSGIGRTFRGRAFENAINEVLRFEFEVEGR